MSKIKPANTTPPPSPETPWYQDPSIVIPLAVPVLGIAAWGVSRYIKNNYPAPFDIDAEHRRFMQAFSKALDLKAEDTKEYPLNRRRINQEFGQALSERLQATLNLKAADIKVYSNLPSSPIAVQVQFDSPYGKITEVFRELFELSPERRGWSYREVTDILGIQPREKDRIFHALSKNIREAQQNLQRYLPKLASLGFNITPASDTFSLDKVTITHPDLPNSRLRTMGVENCKFSILRLENPAFVAVKAEVKLTLNMDNTTKPLTIEVLDSNWNGADFDQKVTFTDPKQFTAYAQRVQAMVDWVRAQTGSVSISMGGKLTWGNPVFQVNLFNFDDFRDPVLDANRNTLHFSSLGELEAGREFILFAQRQLAQESIRRIVMQGVGYELGNGNFKMGTQGLGYADTTFYQGPSFLSTIQNFDQYFRFSIEEGTVKWIGQGTAPVDMHNPAALYAYLEKLAHSTPQYIGAEFGVHPHGSEPRFALNLKLSLEMNEGHLKYVYRNTQGAEIISTESVGKLANGNSITLEVLKTEVNRLQSESKGNQGGGDDNDEPPASGGAAAASGDTAPAAQTDGSENDAEFSRLAAASGAHLLGPELEALTKEFASALAPQTKLQSANGAPISQEMFRGVVEADAEKLAATGSAKTSKTNIPHGSTGSMVAGGAVFGAAFGAADVALDHAGASEGTKHGILGTVGAYFLAQAAAQAPADLLAMFPAAIPGALAGGVAGAGFADTAAAQAVENFVGVDISTAQWSTLGAATGGGITASLGIAAARQTLVYAAAASSSLASTVSGAATAVVGAFEVAGPLALAAAGGYAVGTGLDYGLGYLFTRNGSLSTAIATAGDGAIDVPEGSSEHYRGNTWSYVPDTEG